MPILRPIWQRQPQTAARVNQSSQAARGLLVAHNFAASGLQNLARIPASSFVDVSGISGNASGGGRLGPVSGYAIAATGNRIAVSRQAAHDAITASGAVSLILVGKSAGTDSGGGQSLPLFQRGASIAEHYPFTNGNIYVGPCSNTRWADGISPGSVDLYSPHVFGFSFRNGEQRLYLNGRQIHSNTIAAAPSWDPAFGGNGPCLGKGTAYALFIWNRILSADEFANVSDNPWQLFEPRRIWVPVSAAGGGAYTLTAGQGSYSLTGQAAGLRAARNLTAAQGSYSLSGQSAALRAARALAGGQGSYSLSGQDATVRTARNLPAAQGSYTLSGQTATVRAGRSFAAAQGTYSLSGQDATLTYSGAGAKTLIADQGAYALTGQSAALQVARTLTAGQGAYAYTGQDAALRRLYTLTAGQGAYALTGQPAGILRGLRLPAAQGSYTLSGQAATLTYSGAAGSTISIVQPYITVYFWRRTA